MRSNLNFLQNNYIPERLATIDADFLSFEEDLASDEDIQLIVQAINSKAKLETNPFNSCLLYATGLTNIFDFELARAHTIDGSPPDIDIDFDSLERQKAIQWVGEHWGEEHVAYIITHGKFKVRSTVADYFRVTCPLPLVKENSDKVLNGAAIMAHQQLEREIASKIPKGKFGVEPTLDEIINGNPDKGYHPHPELETNERYAGWLTAARHLENMVKQFGIHAGGIVISDKPITDILPVWWKRHKEKQPNGTTKQIEKRISQYDMGEVETLGLIKFDFLGIDNISVLKECNRLIKERHDIDINPWTIPDGDKATYALLHQGLLTGLFQVEKGCVAKHLINWIQPTSIPELSDI